MTFDEFYGILERVRNGEKAKDIIDFAQPTRSNGITPSEAFSLCMDNIYCKECGKKLQGKEMFYCFDCSNKAKEKYSQGLLGKEYDKNDKMSWVLCLALVSWIFADGDNATKK